MIDGGHGHLNVARQTLQNLDLKLPVICIAKGPRGDYVLPKPPQKLKKQNLYFLQRLRDEAHRFAISAHRKRRARHTSPLDAIPGIGPKRKRALLLHFGSVRILRGAGLKAIKAVPGISHKTATLLHKTLLQNP